jgi:hypothetical protein
MEFSRTAKITIITAALLLSGTWAYAQVAGAQLSACVSRSGDTRILLPGFTSSSCARNERLVTWSVTGPKGDKGDKGDNGAQGLQGYPGIQGATGTPGIAGGNGQNGAPGAKGDMGLPGKQYHLYDANNQDLGVLISATGNRYQTFLPDLGVFVSIHESSLTQTNSPYDPYLSVGDDATALYASADCTGDGFLPVLVPLYVLHDEHGQYLLPTSDLPVTRVSLSVFRSANGGTCQSMSAQAFNATYLLKPITLPFSDPVVKPVHVGL